MLSLTCVITPNVRLGSLWGSLDIRSLAGSRIGWLTHHSLRNIDGEVALPTKLQQIIVSLATIISAFQFESRLRLLVFIVSFLFILHLIFYLSEVTLFSFTDSFLTLLVFHQLPLKDKWVFKVYCFWSESASSDPTRRNILLWRFVGLLGERSDEANLTCAVQFLRKWLNR